MILNYYTSNKKKQCGVPISRACFDLRFESWLLLPPEGMSPHRSRVGPDEETSPQIRWPKTVFFLHHEHYRGSGEAGIGGAKLETKNEYKHYG